MISTRALVPTPSPVLLSGLAKTPNKSWKIVEEMAVVIMADRRKQNGRILNLSKQYTFPTIGINICDQTNTLQSQEVISLLHWHLDKRPRVTFVTTTLNLKHAPVINYTRSLQHGELDHLCQADINDKPAKVSRPNMYTRILLPDYRG